MCGAARGRRRRRVVESSCFQRPVAPHSSGAFRAPLPHMFWMMMFEWCFEWSAGCAEIFWVSCYAKVNTCIAFGSFFWRVPFVSIVLNQTIQKSDHLYSVWERFCILTKGTVQRKFPNAIQVFTFASSFCDYAKMNTCIAFGSYYFWTV